VRQVYNPDKTCASLKDIETLLEGKPIGRSCGVNHYRSLRSRLKLPYETPTIREL
jgi:hypothetical protein